ncbi:hypothetical protein [Jannaschia aquimarina]|uniref:Sulfotransferase family protein n=1 Tax=Jannaschia aquimarina TaxID=935700 RepID=A0A0D1ENB3_9RHOB|nr:hypothetical protein [Jannaschia aquimarina]KIT17175.1 hypothetical protein jaqu_09050 [Jannaschia aquimarina]SNT17826.1 hypothetical protein SAMN05421775_10731 [Jannaschia aquimarina]
MLIFWKARLVVLSVPKTGTTSLEAAFGPYADAVIRHPTGLKHMNVRRWHAQLAPLFEQRGKRPLRTMAVMREPVDWLGSWWRYRSREALDGSENSTAGISFDDFVDAYMQEEPPRFAAIGSQARFLDGGVDHLFPFGRLNDAITFLSTETGATPTVERLNTSPTAEIRLSPERRARLEKVFAADFDLWRGLTSR